MSEVKIFWDPIGLEVDSLRAKTYIRSTDGDTPYVSVSIRMLSIDAPETSAILVATNRPWVWKIGSACSRRSSLVKRQTSFNVSALEARLPWLSMAPFERPVVPDV